jgi:hypothetical protein
MAFTGRLAVLGMTRAALRLQAREAMKRMCGVV